MIWSRSHQLCPGRDAAAQTLVCAAASQIRDRSNPWRSRISGAPRARSCAENAEDFRHALVLHRIRDTNGHFHGARFTIMAWVA
jgi:hypothetical protein